MSGPRIVITPRGDVLVADWIAWGLAAEDSLLLTAVQAAAIGRIAHVRSVTGIYLGIHEGCEGCLHLLETQDGRRMIFCSVCGLSVYGIPPVATYGLLRQHFAALQSSVVAA